MSLSKFFNLEIMQGSAQEVTLFILKILYVFLIFVIGWYLANRLSKTIKNAMLRANIDKGIVSFINSASKTLFKIVVLLIILSTLGLDTSALTATLGVGAVAIGFAMKDSLSNVASGVLIIINKPFKISDYLKIDNLEGTVVKIEILFTTLVTSDNKEIIIPNSNLISKNIVNYNARQERRFSFYFLVGYDTNFEKAKSYLLELITSKDIAFKTPKPCVVIEEYRENHIKLALKLWCKPDDYKNLHTFVQESAKNLFDQKIFSLPFRNSVKS
jgi:small conductance mechanosensitive channel